MDPLCMTPRPKTYHMQDHSLLGICPHCIQVVLAMPNGRALTFTKKPVTPCMTTSSPLVVAEGGAQILLQKQAYACWKDLEGARSATLRPISPRLID
jgi:hypothetical protein